MPQLFTECLLRAQEAPVGEDRLTGLAQGRSAFSGQEVVESRGHLACPPQAFENRAAKGGVRAGPPPLPQQQAWPWCPGGLTSLVLSFRLLPQGGRLTSALKCLLLSDMGGKHKLCFF